MRIFLDANILFSAAKSDGAIRRLLSLLESFGHECVADDYEVEEARRNILAKAAEALADLQSLLADVIVLGIQSANPELEARLPVVEKDRPVLAAAIRGGCDALVTGDSTHFGHLFGQAVEGVTIHSPRSIAESLIL